MSTTKKSFVNIAVLIIISTLLPRYVFAYLDPGSGSYIIQILIASAASILFAIKGQLARIIHFLRRKTNDKSNKKKENIKERQEYEERE